MLLRNDNKPAAEFESEKFIFRHVPSLIIETIEFIISAIISKMWNWFHLPLKTCARLDCGNGVGGEFEKAFSKARTGNLLIVSSFVTKRATVFKYSMNGAESIGGKKFFHRGRPRGAASNLQKLSRNKFCIRSRDTFHSRRLPRTRPTLIPCLASLPFHGRGPNIYLNCNLSIVN